MVRFSILVIAVFGFANPWYFLIALGLWCAWELDNLRKNNSSSNDEDELLYKIENLEKDISRLHSLADSLSSEARADELKMTSLQSQLEREIREKIDLVRKLSKSEAFVEVLQKRVKELEDAADH